MKNILLIIIFFLTACGTTKRPFLDQTAKADFQTQSSKRLIETLYVIGDTGDSDGKSNYVLPALKNLLEQESSTSSIVFLGDQIYPNGMPKKSSKKRAIAEEIMREQLEAIRSFQGKAYFIAGERDWKDNAEDGLKAVKRQEQFLENYFSEKAKTHFYPGKGCADPKVVKITKDLVYVFLDTQWWLQNWADEEKMNRNCEIKSKYDLLEVIKEIFTDHKNDEVVVFMHHPIYSNGNHGGRFSLKDHLFPFAETENVSIPLPVIGSLLIVGRNVTGLRQDIANRHYQELMVGIERIASGLGVNILFAAAHDNGLQHFDKGKMQFIVSGSGSRTHHIGKGRGASFAYQERGFCKVLFYEDFEAWLEIYVVKAPGQKAELVYRTQVRAPRAGTVKEQIQYPPVIKSDTIIAANQNFAASSFKEMMLGSQYRSIWATPVKVPLIDLESQFGGLRPIKKGGGMASNSLRVEKADGKQYILRSINKDYRKLVPPDFGNLKLLNILKDQNSASHPYGALIIPSLSKAAGVYYTDPKLVYLKHQKGLGNYNSQFPEELYLLEERPSGDWSDAAQFGHSEEIIGYTDLLVNLREKKSHFIDQHWVCKSRLFDLFIHDWDRHDDQWRWATFKEVDKTIYRPIPRDRDQAFYKFVGLVPSYVAIFVMKKFKTMKDDVRDVKHLAFNARYFDRYFMNELEWGDWKKEVVELQKKLTDAAIEQAVNAFPEETRGKDDKELVRKLKSRRDKMLTYAKKLYDFQAKEVEITGSDHEDLFEIRTTPNGNTTVKVWVKRNKKGNLIKYERTFYPQETNEIRLYGLRDKDEFILSGAAKNTISLRVIGGEGDDRIINETDGRKVKVYDELQGVSLEGGYLKDKTSEDVDVNEYNRNGFVYNTSFPNLIFGYTLDDGIWFGGSLNWTTHGWRKAPYKSKQSVSLSIAPNSRRAILVDYKAHFPNVIGQLGLAPEVHLSSPRYENYFGLGNNSMEPSNSISYNWVRLESFILSPLLQLNSKDKRTVFQFGPISESHKIENSIGRVSEDATLGFHEEELDRRNFLGGKMSFKTGYVVGGAFPENGFKVASSLSYLSTLSKSDDILNLDASLQFYITLSYRPKLILANNIGYQKVFGQPQFYQYPDLGNTSNLRGFRNNRFRGESAFYQNIDLRLLLFKFKNNFLPMDVGIVGGYDYGRVWLENEDSSNWHKSQTIGLWMNILGMVVLQPYYSFTAEGNIFSLMLGFNF